MVLKVMVAPVQWTRADAMAAAEALVNTGTAPPLHYLKTAHAGSPLQFASQFLNLKRDGAIANEGMEVIEVLVLPAQWLGCI